MVANPRMLTSSGTIVSPSSGSIPSALPAAAVSAERELRDITRLVHDHAEDLLEAWNDHFGK